LPASQVHRILDGLINLIFPDVCFICDVPIARRQDCGICSNCWNKAVGLKIVPPRCSSCGLPFQSFQDDTEHLCGTCILNTPPYSGARAFGHYTAELSRLIQGLKFHGKQNLAGTLGPLLTGAFFDNWDREEFDLIVPVPLHPKRKRQRGYNQSELLSRSLERQIAIPCCSALIRTRATLPQIGLTDSQRQENVRNAFRCKNPTFVLKKRILLIDDVMTTGATVGSASRALMDAGALRVSVLTVARAGKW
jgi:ComF family protein